MNTFLKKVMNRKYFSKNKFWTRLFGDAGDAYFLSLYHIFRLKPAKKHNNFRLQSRNMMQLEVLRNANNNFRKLLLFCLTLFFITGCNSKDKELETYYNNNTKLHQELSESLMNFSKKYKREVTLKKTQFADQHIRLDISFPDRAEWLPIFFDTSYNRHDYNEKTREFAIPKGLIENFDKSIYFGIGSDSTYTFFAYEWDKPKNLIGTSGDSQYGILILKDTVELNKTDKRISRNACITSYGVFH